MTDDVFEDLVNLYLDKEISPAQLRILKEELERHSERRSTFESYCRMHQATHFAALSAAPVIPRLSASLDQGRGKPAFFAFSRQVLAAAAIIVVVGSFATVYFNGPFGKARIVQAQPSNLQPIDTFVPATTVVQTSEPPLEFFRAQRVQSLAEEWAFLHELRHARATSEFPIPQEPSIYTWLEEELREGRQMDSRITPHFDFEATTTTFDFDHSNYEFRK